jgi:hypothetical protein
MRKQCATFPFGKNMEREIGILAEIQLEIVVLLRPES